jgi:hypothetical protein
LIDDAERQRLIRIVDAATAYRAKRITWQEFMRDFGKSKDDMTWDLVDLIEHEPARDGWRGVGEKAWREYENQLDRAIKVLVDATALVEPSSSADRP